MQQGSGSSSSFRAIKHHMCTIDSSNKVITGFSFFTGNSTATKSSQQHFMDLKNNEKASKL